MNFCCVSYKINIDGFIGDAGFMGGDSFTLKDLNRLLDAMPSNTKEIEVVINSGGGYITEGFAIHDRLATVEETVSTKVLGLCGSIATIIAQAPKSQNKGGLRSGHQNSDYFIHPPSWSPQSPDPIEAEELQRIADDLMANQEKIAEFYALTGKGTKDFFLEKMKDAKSLSMDEAKDLGLIDKIITTNIQAATIYKFAAHITKNVTPMNAIEAKIGNMFADFREEIKGLFKPKFKNEMRETSEGVQVWYDGDIEVGKKVWLDEAMTKPAPDGVHTIDGKRCTIAGGEVTAVEEVENKTELEKANARIAELEGQLAAKDAEVNSKIETAIASKETEIKAKVDAEVTKAVTDAVTAKETELTNSFNQKFEAFQSKFFTGGKFKEEIIQQFKNEQDDEPKKGKSPIEIAAELRRAEEEKKKQQK